MPAERNVLGICIRGNRTQNWINTLCNH